MDEAGEIGEEVCVEIAIHRINVNPKKVECNGFQTGNWWPVGSLTAVGLAAQHFDPATRHA